MGFNIKATNISLDDVVRAYLDKRLATLDKLIDWKDPAVMTDIELGRTSKHHQNGDVFFAEITIHHGKETYRAVSERPDIQSAIDTMRDAIAGELSARKGKAISLSRRGGQLAKAFLKGGYDGMAYLGRPARAGWKYVKGLRWGRKDNK
ncbi:MAG: HPF/RaiA family ribosome-associated protein [bacterium]|nr:HPF/RaiA family ribosome-associated protein [bacterium]